MEKEYLEEVYLDSSTFNKAVRELYLDGFYDSLSEANRLASSISSEVTSCDYYIDDINDDMMKKALLFVGYKTGSERLVIFQEVFSSKNKVIEFFKALTWLHISCGESSYV